MEKTTASVVKTADEYAITPKKEEDKPVIKPKKAIKVQPKTATKAPKPVKKTASSQSKPDKKKPIKMKPAADTVGAKQGDKKRQKQEPHGNPDHDHPDLARASSDRKDFQCTSGCGRLIHSDPAFGSFCY